MRFNWSELLSDWLGCKVCLSRMGWRESPLVKECGRLEPLINQGVLGMVVVNPRELRQRNN